MKKKSKYHASFSKRGFAKDCQKIQIFLIKNVEIEYLN